MSEQELNIFAADVEGIGQFWFRRRRLGLDMKISVERARLSEGVALDPLTSVFFVAIADLKVLLVEAPAGCDIQPGKLDELDTFDDSVYGRVLKVWEALTEKEATFRKGSPAGGQSGGQGAGGDVRPVVPETVQPGAD